MKTKHNIILYILILAISGVFLISYSSKNHIVKLDNGDSFRYSYEATGSYEYEQQKIKTSYHLTALHT